MMILRFIFLLIFLPLVLLIILLWIVLYLLINDLAVPLKNANRFKNILVIFPHPDDEINCAGLLHHLSIHGKKITLVILTKGEKGTPDATLNLSLKDIRAKEAQAVASILGISKLIQEDFGDGELKYKKPELMTFIDEALEEDKPDLIITYDLAGMYGHEDHITCSEIVTDLQKNKYQKIALWYFTYPKRLLALAKLPEYMAKDPHFRERRAFPNLKVFTGLSIFAKIKAFYTYKSQNVWSRGWRRFIPLWFVFSLLIFEYFADVS